MWQAVLGSAWHHIRCFRLPRQSVSHSPQVSQITAELVLSNRIDRKLFLFMSFLKVFSTQEQERMLKANALETSCKVCWTCFFLNETRLSCIKGQDAKRWFGRDPSRHTSQPNIANGTCLHVGGFSIRNVMSMLPRLRESNLSSIRLVGHFFAEVNEIPFLDLQEPKNINYVVVFFKTSVLPYQAGI